MKLMLNYTDEHGFSEQKEIASVTAEKGEWTILSNPTFTFPLKYRYPSISIESDGTPTDYYVDNFGAAVKGTKFELTDHGQNESVTTTIQETTTTETASSKQKAAKYATLKKRYDIIKEVLAAHPEYKEAFDPMPCNSGYFMCIKPKGVDAEQLREKLIKDYSTGTIMLSGLIRLAFSAVPTEKLPKLFDNIYNCIMGMKS